MKTDAVGGHLAGVFEEGDAPGEENDQIDRPMGGDFHLLKFQVAVPGKGHEDVGQDEQENGG